MIAAGVLVTILVISLSVYYFDRLKDFSNAILYSKKEELETKEFNQPLLFQEEELSNVTKDNVSTIQTFGRLISALNYVHQVNGNAEFESVRAEVKIDTGEWNSSSNIPNTIHIKGYNANDIETEREKINKLIEFATITVTKSDTSSTMYRAYPTIQNVKYGFRGRIEQITYKLTIKKINR